MDRRNLRDWLSIVLMIALSLVAAALLVSVYNARGDARVINYAGIVRSNTQRLVKEELAGCPDDRTLKRTEQILRELKTGKGSDHIHKLNNSAYQAQLKKMIAAWPQLKAAILKARDDSAQQRTLYRLSEKYFTLTNRTVSAAETAMAQQNRRIATEEIAAAILVLINVVLSIFKGRELMRLSGANSALKQIAFVDPVTGLANSRRCEDRLSDETPIPPDVEIACFMFDLNHLKEVNDRCGHAAGDQLIVSFSAALRKSAVRHMFLGRRGGDEFMAVAVNLGRREAEGFLRQLRENASAQQMEDVFSGVSYAGGYALSSEEPGLNIRQLMDLADKRMYENKAEMKRKAAQ